MDHSDRQALPVLRYMGFDQNKNIRSYRFDRVEAGEPTTELVITVNLELFSTHRVRIQEGPNLCAGKLASNLAKLYSGDHQLTGDDLLAHTAAREAAEARKVEMRGMARRRRERQETSA
jgi:hypothetical protein